VVTSASSKSAMVTMGVSECAAEHVTVYSDRAEVSRILTCQPPAPTATDTLKGEDEEEGEPLCTIVVEGVTGDADCDSIRVKAHADSAPCTILEVSVEERLSGDGLSEGASEARAALAAARKAKTALQNDERRVKAEQELMTSYMHSMLAPGNVGLNAAAPGSASSAIQAGPPIGSDLDALTKLLEFHTTKRAESDARLLELAEELSAADDKIRALEADMHKTRGGSRALRSTSNISIVLSLPRARADEAAGTIKLCLTYLVRSASWAPKYDLRTSLAESEQPAQVDTTKDGAVAPAPTMSLTYYGVIRQSTGEDWGDVSLSLSTASPATGGTPPAPPTRMATWARPKFRAVQGGGGGGRGDRMMLNSAMPMQAEMSRRLSIDADELSDDCEEASCDFMSSLGPVAPVATANVTSGGAGAANFCIERRSTINADNKEHKVTVAIVDITPELQYFATPELEENVYLQARCVNNSACPLLATDAVSIFLDGSFVTKTHLKHTSPGEPFSVFLGVDPSVKISHKLTKRQTETGSDGGAFKSKVPSRLTNEQRTMIHNTKSAAAIKMTLVQLLPRSDDARIVVDLLDPPPSSVQTSKEHDADNSAGEGSLKSGGIMQNAITNNVVFSRTLGPGEKLEVPFCFSISWPHDAGMVEIA